jgi:hypothetical protein
VLAVCGLTAVAFLALLLRSTLVRTLLVRYRYDVYSFLGREPGDDIALNYAEGPHTIEFFGSREPRIVAIPDDAAWPRIMPAWCVARRGDVVGRMRRHADRRHIRLRESSTSDGHCILWIEKRLDGTKRRQAIDW